MSENTRQMRQVVWFFNHNHDLAVPCGEDSFIYRLIRAACKADQVNRGRLHSGFPALVWAVEVIQGDDYGYDKVARAIREEEGAPL
ncbi:MAG: hypothetical protein ACI38U_10185 [Corynebacterium sp.]|uniref:hypothetical protein n=1 Tax=Corynebacterium sp. TaxID=1720 RepID=UPI003F0C7B4C